MTSVMVEAVETGTTYDASCPHCSAPCAANDLVGLTPDGPVLLFLITACAPCGAELMTCLACAEQLDLDGRASYQHVKTHEVSA